MNKKTKNTLNEYVYTKYTNSNMLIRPNSSTFVDSKDETNRLYNIIQNVLKVRDSLATQCLNEHAVKQLDKALKR